MAEYKIELSYGGGVVKTILPLTKREANCCYYTHFHQRTYGVRLYLDGERLTHARTIKHLGRPDKSVLYEKAVMVQ